MAARTGTKAIDRAAQLLVRVVESRDPETVGELAETTGLPRSTASRLVAALERQTSRTFADREELDRELQETLERGYATAVEELEPGLWAIAAPLHGES